MFDNLKNEVKNGSKPLLNIVDIQSNTAQKIAREQLDFMSECLNVSSRQTETLRGNRSADSFLRVPVDTSRELGECLVSTAGRQWSILLEARDALTGEVRSAAKDVGSNVKQAAAKAEDAVQDAESDSTQSSSNAKTRKADKAPGKASAKAENAESDATQASSSNTKTRKTDTAAGKAS